MEKQLDMQLGGDTRADHARERLADESDETPASAADREVDFARSDQEMDEMRAVQGALKRVHAPEFGLCVECGVQIPFDRLQHHPAVLRCVACQSALESARNTPSHRATL